MNGWLLDTNVLSELVRKRPEPAVVETLLKLDADKVMTSSICVVELRYGARRHPRGEALWQRLSQQVLAPLAILPVGEAEAFRAGDILADLARRGEQIGMEDVLIGASAQVAGLAVVTRNVKHFSRIDGLMVESWWPEVG